MLSKSKIVILGIGNLLLKDEGAGVHVVQMLHNDDFGYPNLEIIDGGTSPEIASLIEGVEKLIIIDAVKGGKEPGTVYHFAIDDAELNSPCSASACPTHKETELQFFPRLSLHEMHIIDNLHMLSLVGKRPNNVVVIGIEPKMIEFGLELSPEIQSKIPDLIRLVKNEIEQDISSLPSRQRIKR